MVSRAFERTRRSESGARNGSWWHGTGVCVGSDPSVTTDLPALVLVYERLDANRRKHLSLGCAPLYVSFFGFIVNTSLRCRNQRGLVVDQTHGLYFHNGGILTLRQVVDFYNR